ncbi:CLI_3235 family bacteriocin precursor [Anaerocolumna sp.]|uniref:CLI_3235 family bacteriocin precursor n=1 Tax=Anaerocolumna sp. TaxID=2041569 RepID=UPI0028AF50B3|nr:CLI_3235 family bacteriocin precursor [Anaerocolumna sp.]
MRKLKKSTSILENSVEAYACSCGGCTCGSCDCSCFLGINGNTNANNNGSSAASSASGPSVILKA